MFLACLVRPVAARRLSFDKVLFEVALPEERHRVEVLQHVRLGIPPPPAVVGIGTRRQSASVVPPLSLASSSLDVVGESGRYDFPASSLMRVTQFEIVEKKESALLLTVL